VEGAVRPGGRWLTAGRGCEGPGFDRSRSRGYRGQPCPGCPGPAPVRGAPGWPLGHRGPASRFRPEGGGAESRGATESGPTTSAGPRDGNTPDRGDRTVAGGRIRKGPQQDRHRARPAEQDIREHDPAQV